MAILWPCRKSGVSPCHGGHSKARTMSEACKFDHKLDEAPVAYTTEVHKNDKSREYVELADDAWEVSTDLCPQMFSFP